MRVEIISYGEKHGGCPPCEIQIGTKGLPNPWSDPELQPLSGLDERVQRYVMRDRFAGACVRNVTRQVVEEVLNAGGPITQGTVRVAVGCVGGRHRSVVIAEALAAAL